MDVLKERCLSLEDVARAIDEYNNINTLLSVLHQIVEYRMEERLRAIKDKMEIDLYDRPRCRHCGSELCDEKCR